MLLGFLVRKKVFIFSTVSICFVLSIFYAFSTTLIYRANIGFLAPEKKLTSFFPVTLYEVLPNVVSVSVSDQTLLSVRGFFDTKRTT